MGRIILGIVTGFVVWTILWLGTDSILTATMGWYGKHQVDFQRAMLTGGAFEANPVILLMHIVRAIIISLVAGYIAAWVARENRRTPLILGILLLLFGIMVQAVAWRYLPIWYHISFLLLLIPVTIAGGKLRKYEAPIA